MKSYLDIFQNGDGTNPTMYSLLSETEVENLTEYSIKKFLVSAPSVKIWKYNSILKIWNNLTE